MSHLFITYNISKKQEVWNTSFCKEGYCLLMEIKDVPIEEWIKGKQYLIKYYRVNSGQYMETMNGYLLIFTWAILRSDLNLSSMLTGISNAESWRSF